MIGAERCQIFVGLVPCLLLALGGMHLHDCPKEPMIPIYVIVGSCFFLFIQLLLLCGCGRLCVIPITLILVFIFSWFITGSVFIYRAFQPNFESRHSPEYCEKILYQVAFWCNNLGWVSMLVFGMCAFCRFLCRVFIERANTQKDIKVASDSEGGSEAEEGTDIERGADIERGGGEGHDIERGADMERGGGEGDDTETGADVERGADIKSGGGIEKGGGEGDKGVSKGDEEKGESRLDENQSATPVFSPVSSATAEEQSANQ